MEVSALKTALKELKAGASGEHDLGVGWSKVGTALYQPKLLFLNREIPQNSMSIKLGLWI